jgi:hypothetical protein
MVDQEKGQLSLFGGKNGLLYNELMGIDPDRITPLEAHHLLYKWKKMVEKGD